MVSLYESNGTLASIASISALQKAKQITDNRGFYWPSEVIDHMNKLIKQGEVNVVSTNENGEFAFYGLDPAKTYEVRFTYNGMRYDEIKASTEVKISGYDTTKEEASRALQNEQERKEMNERFSEIGAYPYNYLTKIGTYNKTFTQTEVEEAIKEG